MVVIADTSPLNYLIQLGLADGLALLYKSITVPAAVREELSHPNTPAPVRTWVQSPPAWVTIATAANNDLQLSSNLGSGETEAILLALEHSAVTLLADDRLAREEAIARGIPVTGTAAIIAASAQRAKCPLQETLRGLRELGFRLSPAVEGAVIERASTGQASDT